MHLSRAGSRGINNAALSLLYHPSTLTKPLLSSCTSSSSCSSSSKALSVGPRCPHLASPALMLPVASFRRFRSTLAVPAAPASSDTSSSLPVSSTAASSLSSLPVPSSASASSASDAAELPVSSAEPASFTPSPASTLSAPSTFAGTLDFNDATSIFESRSTWEVLRGYAAFKLSSYPLFVMNSRRLLSLSNLVLGEAFTSWTLRHTFFGHFCGGETNEELLPLMDKLRKAGIRPILDYAAEADVAAHLLPAENAYDGEEHCNAHVATFLSCIEAAGAREKGFAAIKLTALGKPELLERVSTILSATRNLFQTLAADGPEVLDFERKISLSQFRKGMQRLGAQVAEENLDALFRRLDADGNGVVEYLDWIEHFSLNDEAIRPFPIPQLTEEEKKQMANMVRRLDTIAEAASRKKVRLMIDAEHTYFQPAIDYLAVELQKKYNKEYPVIFNTYQAYLRDCAGRVRIDLQRAKNQGFIFAAKIVRGAYMIQERNRAEELGYPDPICPDIEATHANFDGIVSMILNSQQPTELMVASHNEDSVRKTVDHLNLLGPEYKNRVFFGQLLGMCDYVSYTLGRYGYGVYKYVPYGPIKEVIPYLIRRAEENVGLLGRADKERNMLFDELKRRLFTLASK